MMDIVIDNLGEIDWSSSIHCHHARAGLNADADAATHAVAATDAVAATNTVGGYGRRGDSRGCCRA
jgi:hypothetical protein